MRISELIEQLKQGKAKHGDLPVVTWDDFLGEWAPVELAPRIFGDDDDAIRIDPRN